ncbi:MAG: VanW family protein [Candidatus Peregrinibacteria bacterium]|nr:VanW family protein [Candidatus Peregrinibacteria bacterium]
MKLIWRLLLFIGVILVFPSLSLAAEVPSNIILKTDFKIWELNPQKMDIFSDYEKLSFGDLPIALLGADRETASPLVSQEKVQGIDRMKIRNYLESRVAPQIYREKTDVVIDMDENGEVIFEGTGLYGRRLDLEKATQMFLYAIENNLRYVHLPLIREDPVVMVESDELKKLGIVEQLSSGETDFTGSPYNRTVNINIGLSRFEGHIIKPGEEFVFGNTLGPVDGSTGYLKELVIKGPKTVPEYGGGLCQVSTTAYRAVLNSGLPITERRNHSYAVSYYSPLGLDATVYPPSIEMKFLNDTPNHIVMQSFTQGGIAYYNFYGTKTNRRVHLIGPYYSSWTSPPPTKIEYSSNLAPGERMVVGKAVSGVNVTWYRYVEYPEGEKMVDEETGEEKPKTFMETIYSRYQARPNYYIVGSSASSPAPEVSENGT